MGYLFLVRHGESRWNLSNKFTGWVDVPLSQKGVQDVMGVADTLNNVELHHAFTSNLERAHQTLTIILSRQKMTGIFLHPDEKKKSWYTFDESKNGHDIQVHATALLNERYYGKLQGMDKDAARKKFGEDVVKKWRRGWDERPPGGESIKDVYKRAMPFFKKHVTPLLEDNKNVIISAHGNTLRAVLKYIENMPPDKIPHLNLPPAELITYDFQKGMFSRSDGGFNFDRPMFWDSEDYNGVGKGK
jgi:2,3-bisphosphoglycerate-dependent phosphoglycerate mutase